MQYHIYSWDCINLKQKRFFHYDGKCLDCPKKITQCSSKSLKAVVQATGEWMFSSASTGWRHSLAHFIKHPSCYCQLSWVWMPKRLDQRIFRTLCSPWSVSSFPNLLFTRVWAFKSISLLRKIKFCLYKKKKELFVEETKCFIRIKTRKSILKEQIIVCMNKYIFHQVLLTLFLCCTTESQPTNENFLFTASHSELIGFTSPVKAVGWVCL